MLGFLDDIFCQLEGKPTRSEEREKRQVSKAPTAEKNRQGLGSLLYSLFVSDEYRNKGLSGWKDDKEKFKIDLVNDIKNFLFTKWEKPWVPGLIFDTKNMVVSGFRNVTGRIYHNSSNILSLKQNKGESPFFITLARLLKEGGKILDKTKVTSIISFIPIVKDEAPVNGTEEGKKPDYMLPRFHPVINVDFVEGIKKPIYKTVDFKNLELNEYVEAFIAEIKKRKRIPTLIYDQADRCYYTHNLDFRTDEIHLVQTKQFKGIGEYYSTLFHEITHSTMNPSRLGRGKSKTLRQVSYANEELVAEMGAMIICSELGLEYARQNSLSYLSGWLKEAKGTADDAMLEAYAFACDAAEYLLEGIDLTKLVPETMTTRAEEVENEPVTAKPDGKKRIPKEWNKYLLSTGVDFRNNGDETTPEPEKPKYKGRPSNREKLLESIKKNPPTQKQSDKVEIIDFPIKDISTDEKRFQNRKNAFSEDSKNRIIKAFENGSFDWSKFDPITLWKDKNGKVYVLSGHSRYAAFKERKMATIPAKFFKGTEAQAIDLALNSNTLSTKETDVERAMYYNRQRETCELKNLSGLGAKSDCEKEVESACREAEGKNANFILNLSYLNPEGYLIDTLSRLGAEKDNDSTNVLRTVANWIGEARRNNFAINNEQEAEIAKFLLNGGYGNKTWQFRNKAQFNERLDYSFNKWKARGAKPGDNLNLANTLSKSTFEKEFDERVFKAKQDYDNAVAEHEEKHKKYLLAVMDKQITHEKMSDLMKPVVAWVENARKEYERVRGQKDDVKKAAEAQTSLFGMEKIGEVKAGKLHKMGGELGKFIGGYEKQNYSIVLRGDKGAGKSRLMYQLLDLFASNKLKCGFLSLEMASNSSVSTGYRDKYISEKNKDLIHISNQALDYDSLNSLCKIYDVLAVDSWTKLRGLKQEDFDRLQKENPQTIILAIFQSTTGKVTRGGNMPEFDAAIVIHVHEGGIAECEKNRYQATDLTYNVFEKKIIRAEVESN